MSNSGIGKSLEIVIAFVDNSSSKHFHKSNSRNSEMFTHIKPRRVCKCCVKRTGYAKSSDFQKCLPKNLQYVSFDQFHQQYSNDFWHFWKRWNLIYFNHNYIRSFIRLKMLSDEKHECNESSVEKGWKNALDGGAICRQLCPNALFLLGALWMAGFLLCPVDHKSTNSHSYLASKCTAVTGQQIHHGTATLGALTLH